MSASVPTPSPSETPFTGERFLPSCSGEIAYEHWHRYAFARRFAQGKRVLDAACGEGYGTALLGAVAASAVGVDIDLATIAHARATYGEGTRAHFAATSCTGLPLPSASFDVVVSFETIEHLSAEEQLDMLSEFARVLASDGVLVISSPNKRLYSDARGYVNPFHVQELYRDDLARLLGKRFPAQRWYHQRLACWSGIWSEQTEKEESGPAETAAGFETWIGDANSIAPYETPEGMYFIVVAARNAAALPAEHASVSLFTDADDSELKRAERQTDHIHHLEALVVERERIIGERDRQLGEANAAQAERDAELARRAETIAGLSKRSAALQSEKTRLEAALAAQERAIAYLQSFRGWIGWPWRRLRQWLAR